MVSPFLDFASDFNYEVRLKQRRVEMILTRIEATVKILSGETGRRDRIAVHRVLATRWVVNEWKNGFEIENIPYRYSSIHQEHPQI